MLVNCVAYQEGKKLADIAVEEIRRLREPAGVLRLGGAEGPPSPPSSPTCRRSSTCTSSRSRTRGTATSGRRSRSTATRCSSCSTPSSRPATSCTSARSTSSSAATTCSRCATAREHGFTDVRARCEREPELLATARATCSTRSWTRWSTATSRCSTRSRCELESVEERIFAGNTARANIEALYGLKRKLMMLKHAVEPLLEAAGKLHGGRVPQVCAGHAGIFPRRLRPPAAAQPVDRQPARHGDHRDHRSTCRCITLQESEITKRLAAYAALVAVPTMIAGIYGMNFEHMPELDWDWGYPVALGVMVAIDVYLFSRFRKAGWL